MLQLKTHRVHALQLLMLMSIGALAVSAGGTAAQDDDTRAPSVTVELLGPKADTEALLRLGDLYFDGEAVAQDENRAFNYYRQAAEAGSQTGKLRMGEMLVMGVGVTQDIEHGRELIEDAAIAGRIAALLTLGDIFSRGHAVPMDASIAIKAYEKAVSRGNTQAMLRLGDIYRYGRWKSPEYVKAAAYFRRAADAGNPYGLHSLGRVLLEGLAPKVGSPAIGLKLLKEADRAGVAEATVAIANGYFYGHGLRRDAKKAMEILLKAAKQGSVPAAKELISAYRDGKRDGRQVLVKRNLSKARVVLAEINSKISPRETAVEQFLIDSASAPSKSYRKFYERLRTYPARDQSVLIRKLRTANPKLYVFFAQSRLWEIRAFTGKATGKLNGRTSRAIRRYCQNTATPYFCNAGPMSARSAEMLSYAFINRPQGGWSAPEIISTTPSCVGNTTITLREYDKKQTVSSIADTLRLKVVLTKIGDLSQCRMTVSASTSPTGSKAVNAYVAKMRAEAVVALVVMAGASPNRITITEPKSGERCVTISIAP